MLVLQRDFEIQKMVLADSEVIYTLPRLFAAFLSRKMDIFRRAFARISNRNLFHTLCIYRRKTSFRRGHRFPDDVHNWGMRAISPLEFTSFNSTVQVLSKRKRRDQNVSPFFKCIIASSSIDFEVRLISGMLPELFQVVPFWCTPRRYTYIP